MGRPVPPSHEAAARVNVPTEGKENLKKFEIRKEDMNRLVMNFLVKEGLTDAAKKFEEESGTKYIAPPPGLIDREAVKRLLSCGGVDEAIKLVCDVDPQMFHSNVHLQYHVYQEKFIDLLTWESLVPERVIEGLNFAREKIVPIVEQHPEIFRDDFEASAASLLVAENYEALNRRTATAITVMNEAILQRQIDQEWLTILYILKKLQYVERGIE